MCTSYTTRDSPQPGADQRTGPAVRRPRRAARRRPNRPRQLQPQAPQEDGTARRWKQIGPSQTTVYVRPGPADGAARVPAGRGSHNPTTQSTPRNAVTGAGFARVPGVRTRSGTRGCIRTRSCNSTRSPLRTASGSTPTGPAARRPTGPSGTYAWPTCEPATPSSSGGSTASAATCATSSTSSHPCKPAASGSGR